MHGEGVVLVQRHSAPLRILKKNVRKYLILGKLKLKHQNDIFWKVTISVPDIREMPFGLNNIEQALYQYIQWKSGSGWTKAVDQFKINSAKHFTYCIEKRVGLTTADCGSNGIIVIGKEANGLLLEVI